MNPQLFKFFRDLWADLRDPDVVWQLGTLVLCLVFAGWLARMLRQRFDRHVRTREDAGRVFGEQMRLVTGGFSRILFPGIALPLVLVARAVLVHFHHVNFLTLAIPLLFAFAGIRALVYLLRQVFAPSGTLVAGERWLTILVWIGVALHLTGTLPQVIEWLEQVRFHLGKQSISLWLILQAAFSVALTLLVSLWASALIERRLMAAETLDMSFRVVLGRFAKAILVLVAILTSLALVGIDLTVLSVFGGALGVGLGLGLQRIASNYLSGFIILLDRSIRIGDMVTVDKYSGSVTQINTRYTVLKALDGTEAIIPNETLVSAPVQNLSYTTRENRLAIQVTVAYDSDLDKVMSIMLAAAGSNPRVLAEQAPKVFLTRFGADGLELEMGFWIQDPEAGSLNVRSDLNLAIWREFKLHGISVPFPQREVRLLGDVSGKPAAQSST